MSFRFRALVVNLDVFFFSRCQVINQKHISATIRVCPVEKVISRTFQRSCPRLKRLKVPTTATRRIIRVRIFHAGLFICYAATFSVTDFVISVHYSMSMSNINVSSSSRHDHHSSIQNVSRGFKMPDNFRFVAFVTNLSCFSHRTFQLFLEAN